MGIFAVETGEISVCKLEMGKKVFEMVRVGWEWYEHENILFIYILLNKVPRSSLDHEKCPTVQYFQKCLFTGKNCNLVQDFYVSKC